MEESNLLRTGWSGRVADEAVIAEVALQAGPDGKVVGASYTWGCCCGQAAGVGVTVGVGPEGQACCGS